MCGYFTEAARSQGVTRRVKLILLKLFERYVLRDLDQLYDQANQLLADAGVLPELKPTPRRRADDRRQSVQRLSAELARDEAPDLDGAGQAFFDSVQALLAPIRGRIAPRVQQVASAQPISTADLLRLLSHLQHYVPATCEADDFSLGQQLEQLLLRVSVRSGTRRRIDTADEDTLNLVGLLFDFIQADNNLPVSLRGLIARLHIPLLKVALLDKGLFSRASHPARRLLNEIAAAAIGWESGSEGVRDSLHLRVERVIQRLLNDFTDDSRVFADLLEDFLAFNQKSGGATNCSNSAPVTPKRARPALQARQRVQQALNLRLQGRVLPHAVVHMLVHGWSQVLLLAWLRRAKTPAPGAMAWTQSMPCWPASPRTEIHRRGSACCNRCRCCSRTCATDWPGWSPKPPRPGSSSCDWSSCTCAPLLAVTFHPPTARLTG